MSVAIYCIKDPDSKDIVYVGQTKRTLEIRLNGHLSEKKNSEKCHWLKSLKDRNTNPMIELIETVSADQALIRENYWISVFSPKFNVGAKRPLKYDSPTVMLQFRVPKSKKAEFKKLIAPILKKWETKKSK